MNPQHFFADSRIGRFGDLDFGIGQAVQFEGEPVNLPIRGNESKREKTTQLTSLPNAGFDWSCSGR